VDGTPRGELSFHDEVRPEAAEAVRRLHQHAIRTEILTGDKRPVAEVVQAQLGIDAVTADQLPDQKHQVIQGKKRTIMPGTVAMVGDGINDAAALAAADVGFAMTAGTDIAKAAASVTLLRPDLRLVPTAIELSRATVRTIRQNLWLAFGYNVLMVPLAAVGVVSPIAAAVAMSLSSLSVIGNSLRLRRPASS
jgi:Cu+-exporting ATPase